MKIKRILRMFSAALLLGACSPATLLNAFVPNEGYVLHEELVYGDAYRQALDIYRPENAPDSAPVVVYFYGGSWKSGSRGNYRFMVEALAHSGFVVAIPDYRLYPDVRSPISSMTAPGRFNGFAPMPGRSAEIPTTSFSWAIRPARISLHCWPSTKPI